MYFIRQLFHLITGSTQGPVLAIGEMVAFTARLVQSRAQDFPSSQLAMQPFCFFGAIDGSKQPLRWRVSAPAACEFWYKPRRRRAWIEHASAFACFRASHPVRRSGSIARSNVPRGRRAGRPIGRYGYRKIATLPLWSVTDGRVERILG
jgi:hypothetical protein